MAMDTTQVRGKPRANYYVYCLFRADGRPFYIGKGTKCRIDEHVRDVKRGDQKARKLNPAKWGVISRMLEAGRIDIPRVRLAEGLTHEEANAYEMAFIRALGRGQNGPLVNRTDGGDGTVGYALSPETKAKMSLKLSGKGPLSAEHKAKISASLRGRERAPEWGAKLSVALLGQKKSPEHCAALSRALRGRKLSPNHAAKARTAAVGIKRSAAHKAVVSAANRSRSWTAEMRAKSSASARLRWGRNALP